MSRGGRLLRPLLGPDCFLFTNAVSNLFCFFYRCCALAGVAMFSISIMLY